MAVSKSVIVLLALVAVAAAEHARVKKQVIVPGTYQYALAEDDGSWAPGKYDPIAPLAYPYAAGLPYTGPLPYSGALPFAGALPYTAPISYAAPLPYAAALPYAAVHAGDDGSYFAGKYGPENQ